MLTIVASDLSEVGMGDWVEFLCFQIVENHQESNAKCSHTFGGQATVVHLHGNTDNTTAICLSFSSLKTRLSLFFR